MKENKNQDYFDINEISNFADKCVNYNNDENHHFKPYFFCKLCKIQFCYNCICSHIEKNNKDNKHNMNSIISQNGIISDLIRVYNEILCSRKDINAIINYYKNEIELKKKRTIEIKDQINENLNILENNYTNILEYLINENLNIEEIIKKLYNKISYINNSYDNKDKENLLKIYNDMKSVNETKKNFDEKYSEISDYYMQIKNIKKSKITNIYNIMTNFYKNEFNEVFPQVSNTDDNLDKNYINKKRKRNEKEEEQEKEQEKEKEKEIEVDADVDAGEGEEDEEDEDEEEKEDDEKEKNDIKKDINNKDHLKFFEKNIYNNATNKMPFNNINKYPAIKIINDNINKFNSEIDKNLKIDSNPYLDNISFSPIKKEKEKYILQEDKNNNQLNQKKPEDNFKYFGKMIFFYFDTQLLSTKDLRIIDKRDKQIDNKYFLYFIPKSSKINVFSIQEKKVYLCDYKIENISNSFTIKYMLNSNNFKTICANNSLYIIGAKYEGNKKIRDLIRKKICKVTYNPNENICSIEIINETNFNRQNCSSIYCKYYNIIICVGGKGGRGKGYLNSSEFLNLSKEAQGWQNFEKKTNNFLTDEKLFILNDTKLFLIGGFTRTYKTNYNCEMLDIKEEMANIKSNKIPDNNDKYWSLIQINDNNFRIDRNSGLIHVKYLDEEGIIIFGGEKDKPSNYSDYYFLKYSEQENIIYAKNYNLVHLNISQFIFEQNFTSSDDLIVFDEERNNKLPLMFNFDYGGNLWILYSNKLRKFI